MKHPGPKPYDDHGGTVIRFEHPDTRQAALALESYQNVWTDTLRSYLKQQIAQAADYEERAAAVRLAKALAEV